MKHFLKNVCSKDRFQKHFLPVTWARNISKYRQDYRQGSPNAQSQLYYGTLFLKGKRTFRANMLLYDQFMLFYKAFNNKQYANTTYE